MRDLTDFSKVANKKLFLKYAIPCGRVLVKRNLIKQEYLDSIEDSVIKKLELKDEYVEVFDSAILMMTQMASKREKDVIDDDIIHDYFLKRHNEYLKHRVMEVDDVDERLCRVHVCPIENVHDGIALAHLPTGEDREIRLDFIPDARDGDNVAVHYNYGCEIIKN